MNTTKSELTTEQNDVIYDVFIDLCENKLTKSAIKLISLMSNQKINYIDNQGNSTLYYACKNGLTDVIYKLLEVIDMNIINKQYNLIDLMVKNDMTEQIQKFIPNMTKKTKNYTLVLACQYKNTKLAIQLIDKLNDHIIDYVDDQGNSVLYYACKYGLYEVVNEILKHLPKQNTTDVLNSILFYWCVPIELCKIINNHFVDCLTDDNIILVFDKQNKNSKLQYGLLHFWDVSNINMLKLLDKKPNETLILHIVHKISKKQLEYVNNFGDTILLKSIINGFQYVANYLVTVLPKNIINHVNISNDIALYYAINYNMYELIKIIDSQFPDNALEYIKKHGNKALIEACKNDNPEVALLLIPVMSVHAVFAIDDSDEKKNIALHYACINQLTEVAIALINKSGIFMKHCNSHNKTPLHYACEYGLTEVAIALINSQVTMSNYVINQVDFKNKTVLYYAKQNNMTEVIEILQPEVLKYISTMTKMMQLKFLCCNGLTYEATIIINNISDETFDYIYRNDKTILHYACQNNLTEVAHALINRFDLMSIDTINRVDSENKTALYYAKQNNMTKVIEILQPKVLEYITTFTNIDQLKLFCYNGLTHEAIALIPDISIDDINQVDYQKKTVLHYACENELSEIAYVLVPTMSTVAINQVDRYKQTALDYAMNNKMTDLIKNVINYATDKKMYDLIRVLSVEFPNNSLKNIKKHGNKTIINACKNNLLKLMFAILPIMPDYAINQVDDDETASYFANKNKWNDVIIEIVKYSTHESLWNMIHRYSDIQEIIKEIFSDDYITKLSSYYAKN